MKILEKNSPDDERAAPQPVTQTVTPSPPGPGLVGLSSFAGLQTTVGNVAVGQMLGRVPTAAPLLLEGPKAPLLLEYHPLTPAAPQAVQPAEPAPKSVTGEPIYVGPHGDQHSRKELVQDRAALIEILDATVREVFAGRRELIRRSAELGLQLGAHIKTNQYAAVPHDFSIEVPSATEALVEKAWLDPRIALLKPARWDLEFAKQVRAATATEAKWTGLKPDWTKLHDNWSALKAALVAPAPLPDGLAERVAGLTRGYLKLRSYPRLKELYGDKVQKTGVRDTQIGKAHIDPLRAELPDVFTEPDELYQEAYRDVTLLMRSGEVTKDTLRKWGGGSPTQRYLPKQDLQFTDNQDDTEWKYHLSVSFTQNPKSPDWVKITSVHVTFRAGDTEKASDPRYFWNVNKGDLDASGRPGGPHRDWMPAKALALLNKYAKEIDCRPVT